MKGSIQGTSEKLKLYSLHVLGEVQRRFGKMGRKMKSLRGKQ